MNGYKIQRKRGNDKGVYIQKSLYMYHELRWSKRTENDLK